MAREENARSLLAELVSMIDNGSQKDLDRADEISTCIIKLLEQEPKTGAFDKIRTELLDNAEMHEDGDYYIRDKWVSEIIGKYREQERKVRHWIENEKQAPCEDCVSRKAVIDAIHNTMCKFFEETSDEQEEPMDDKDKLLLTVNKEIAGAIRKLPLTKAEQKTGNWIMPIQDDGMSDPIYYQVRCSECEFDLDPQTWYQELHQYGGDEYCPNCGAKMEGERKNEWWKL